MMGYVPPYGTYRCTFSTFPGIFPGTVGVWNDRGWTVNGFTTPGGVPGFYERIPGGFSWSNGFAVCRWEKIG